jgi:hypothetical protein
LEQPCDSANSQIAEIAINRLLSSGFFTFRLIAPLDFGERALSLSGLVPLSFIQVRATTTLADHGRPFGLPRLHFARVFQNANEIATDWTVTDGVSALQDLAIRWIAGEINDIWWEHYEHYAPLSELLSGGPVDVSRGYGCSDDS